MSEATARRSAQGTYRAAAVSLAGSSGLAGIGHESVVSCDNIVTIEKAALGERIGYLFPAQEHLLTAAIRAAFDLE